MELNTKQEADFVLANIIRKLFSFQRIYGNYIYMYIYLYMAPWQRFAVSLKKIIIWVHFNSFRNVYQTLAKSYVDRIYTKL